MNRVIIFGATSAVAQSMARIYAGEGRALTLLARNQQQLDIVKADLLARGASDVSSICCDLADTTLHAVTLDGLEKSAELESADCHFFYGVLPDQAACEHSAEETLAVMNVNFSSVVSWLNLLAQRNVARLIVVSSVAGDRGRQSNYTYGASKGALSTYLQGLRNRLTGRGIPVITIKPGFIDTPMTAHLEKSGLLWAKPEKVAQDIVKAVEKDSDLVYSPWFWRYIMLVVKLIPERLFKRLSL